MPIADYNANPPTLPGNLGEHTPMDKAAAIRECRELKTLLEFGNWQSGIRERIQYRLAFVKDEIVNHTLKELHDDIL